jgi:hypothetical protein
MNVRVPTILNKPHFASGTNVTSTSTSLSERKSSRKIEPNEALKGTECDRTNSLKVVAERSHPQT